MKKACMINQIFFKKKDFYISPSNISLLILMPIGMYALIILNYFIINFRENFRESVYEYFYIIIMMVAWVILSIYIKKKMALDQCEKKMSLLKFILVFFIYYIPLFLYLISITNWESFSN